MLIPAFALDYHPGTRHPADFHSHIAIAQRREAGNGIIDTADISMNRIYQHHGYRFYQANYDRDLGGSLLAVTRDPWGIGITYTGYAMLLAALFLLVAHLLEPHPTAVGPLMPVLRSGLLYVHVSVIMLAYALLTLCTAHSLMALWRKEKSRQQQSSSLLPPAMALLAAGIFIGAVWANQSWGTYWSWDPKEVWALITLMVYAVALHRRSIPWLQHPRHYHLFICVAYLCMLITYFGVNYFLGGMHAYA